MIYDWDLWPGIIARGPIDDEIFDEIAKVFRSLAMTVAQAGEVMSRVCEAVRSSMASSELFAALIVSLELPPDNGPSPDWYPEQMIGDRG